MRRIRQVHTYLRRNSHFDKAFVTIVFSEEVPWLCWCYVRASSSCFDERAVAVIIRHAFDSLDRLKLKKGLLKYKGGCGNLGDTMET